MRIPPHFCVALIVSMSCSHIVMGDAGGTRLSNSSSKTAPNVSVRGRAKITTLKAKDLARQTLKGGKVRHLVRARVEGIPTFHVYVQVSNNRLKCVAIDAMTGKVTQVEDEGLLLGMWSFDNDTVGQQPDQWVIRQNNPTKSMATWTVVSNPDAPSPPNMLNVHSNNENATFNLALVRETSFKNVDLRVQVEANSGRLDQGGGLIWRAKNDKNYYVCRINPLESNYRVYKVENGKRHELKSADVKTYRGSWHTLRAVMVDDQITCYLDDQKYLEIKDSTFADAGMIGLWTKADASSSFDDVLLLQAGVQGPPSAPAN